MTGIAQPFTLSVAQSDILDMQERIRSTRWPGYIDNNDGRYGVPQGWMREMADYWIGGFDWRAQESAINALPNYSVTIDGQDIHFLHIRGKGPDPLPLILTHGWPWTFWDYRALVAPLTDPAAFGEDPTQSFDLIIPSLPGYGFSPLSRSGIGVSDVATLWLRLMRDVLGYRRFAAAGGDWGAAVTSYLGHCFPEALIGIYATMVVLPGLEPGSITEEDYAQDERWMIERNREGGQLIASHVAVQTTDPQTLAYALTDSPVGLAAWLWERRLAWSDHSAEPALYRDRDSLCTLASIYWLTGTIGSSFRLYAEQFRSGFGIPRAHDRRPVISVPTAYAIFPKEVSLLPKAAVERQVNLRRWTVASAGGHFAPVEQPEFLVEELRAFFAPLRSD